MNIHQFLTSYSYGDAIGNESWEIRDYLRSKGIGSEIFALFYHPRYASEVCNYLEYDRHRRSDDVVIFHFSIGSPVTKKFLRLQAKKVIIYHNITPHQFFLDYHRTLSKDCFKGRIELKSLADKVDLALGDSEYNRQELAAAGFQKTGVLPLVMDFSKFDREVLPVFREIFADGKINVLYVGRILPNKKIEDVIKVFHCFQKYYNPDSRLLVVGENRGFERYLHALQEFVTRLKTRNVHFTGHIPLDEVVSYYKLSHLYLHLSEHEGFCAPIPESYFLNIPVVAFAAGAVEETMNGGGVLIRQKNWLPTAGLMAEILANPKVKKAILASQKKALNKYQMAKTGTILLDYINRL